MSSGLSETFSSLERKHLIARNDYQITTTKMGNKSSEIELTILFIIIINHKNNKSLFFYSRYCFLWFAPCGPHVSVMTAMPNVPNSSDVILCNSIPKLDWKLLIGSDHRISLLSIINNNII